MSELFYHKNTDFFIDLIKRDIHFKYSRYNDGELIAIIGQTPHKTNCDGHLYFPDMSNDLMSALVNYDGNEYYFLESFIHWYNLLPHINKILHTLKDRNDKLKFLHDDFIRISHEQQPEKFIELMNLIMNKEKVVIIGPEYLSKLSKHFSFKHIVVPVKNCYLEKNRIISDIKSYNLLSDDHFYLFSASMATNVIIDAFKNDNKNTYIDWGSVWDTFFVSPEYSFIKKRSTSSGDIYKNIYKNYLI